MRILCYGDSNTWGYSPIDGSRFPEDVRWPGVMKLSLGGDFQVIEEGLNGRTIGNFLPGASPLNGLRYLELMLQRRVLDDVDIVILYLGINDLFQGRDITPEQIAARLLHGVELLLDDEFFPRPKIPDVIVLSPLPVNESIEYAGMYGREIEISRFFYRETARVLKEFPVTVVDTGSIIEASVRDGVHIEGEQHIKLGNALAGRIV